MKVEEAGASARDGRDASANGNDPSAADAREPGAFPAQPPVAARSRLLRSLYWLVWFALVPIVLACLLVWALTPPSGVDRGGALGWIEGVVREQPVPMGIVIFTLFEMALWAARQLLPLASHAHTPLRTDLPSAMRNPFERARALLDEADMILQKHAKSVVRDLTVKEREKLTVDLDGLRAAMDKTPFDEDGFVDALVKADGEVDVRLGRWRKSEVREYVEAILMATLVAFGLRAFVVEAFKIPSGSMIPTLQVGDHIFVNKFSYGPAIPWTKTRLWKNMPPHRGDVMVFAFPEHPEQDFIKRVIAIPGDKLEAKNGHPWINGWEVPSCRVGIYSYNDVDPVAMRHEGELFVEYLGDESYLTFYDHASGMFPEYQGPYLVAKPGDPCTPHERSCGDDGKEPGQVWVMGDNRNNSHDSRMWFGGQGGGVPFENIRGRALFVWLSVSDNGVDWSRLFAPVMGRPRLPPAMRPTLEADLDKCLAKRPPIEKTTPPPPH